MGIRKRKPIQSKYVYTDEGVLVVKTPAETTKWGNDFRLRIVRDYVAPRTLQPFVTFKAHFLDPGLQEQVYRVSGHNVMVTQPYSKVSSNHAVVLCTKVIDLDAGQELALIHNNPAMRVLMVYSFLSGKNIGGVPKLSIVEHSP